MAEGEQVWSVSGKVGQKDTERYSIPLLQPGVYSFYLKKTESVKAPTRTGQAELRVFDDQGSIIFERSWRAIGGIDSPKDPKKARASFDLLSEHLASRPGVVEVVVRSNVIMGKLSFRAVLMRRLRLVPTSPQTSPRSSPRLERESTRKSPAPDAKEKRVSARKSGMPDTGMLGTITSLLGSGKPKGPKRDVFAVDSLLEACLSWFERSNINQNHIISMPPSPHSAEDLQRIKQEFEWGEPGQELPSSLDPGTVLELLRQWVVTIDSIVPITFSECLMLAFRQTDFQAQRAAFATLITHLPARNFAMIRRFAYFFHTVHIHPSVFVRAGIPLESAIMRPYWKDSSGSGRDIQSRFDASAKLIALLVDEFEFVFENSNSDTDFFEGCQRMPEKDRTAFFQDLRQACLFLGLKVSEKFLKEAQRKTVSIAPPPVPQPAPQPTPKPTTEPPESPKRKTSSPREPRSSVNLLRNGTDSPRTSDSPRKSDMLVKTRSLTSLLSGITTTYQVKCGGCDGEMQIVIVDGKIYHASCTPIATPPKATPVAAPPLVTANIAVVSRNPSSAAPAAPPLASDTIYAPLPTLPRYSEPGAPSPKIAALSAAAETSFSAPLAPNPLRTTALLPSQEDLLRAASTESERLPRSPPLSPVSRDSGRDKSLEKEKQRDISPMEFLRETSKDKSRDAISRESSRDKVHDRDAITRESSRDKAQDRDAISRESSRDKAQEGGPGHKRQPSWTHALPSVRLSARPSDMLRTSSGGAPPLNPVPKPPPAVAPSPTPEPLLEPIASVPAPTPLRVLSPPPLVGSSRNSSGGLPPRVLSPPPGAVVGSQRAISPPSANAAPASVSLAAPSPLAATSTASDPFSDDPDAAEIERLAELIEEGRFSDVEAYLLLMGDQPLQVESRARKLSIVLARKLSEAGSGSPVQSRIKSEAPP